MRRNPETSARANLAHFLAEQDIYSLSRLQSPSLFLSFADRSLSANIRYYKQLSLRTLKSLVSSNKIRSISKSDTKNAWTPARDESRQLTNAGYDGLYYDDPDNIVSCGCLASDLYPCGERQPECMPGYRVPSSEKLGDHDWYISPKKKLFSPDNYYTHKWRTYITPSTPDSPPESIHMCGICGIEDIGSPEEFDINYPPCEPA